MLLASKKSALFSQYIGDLRLRESDLKRANLRAD
jgi:hypothetical protein